MLDLSRLQNADFPIEKEVINLCDVVQDAARASKHLGQQKNVQVDLQLDKNLYLIERTPAPDADDFSGQQH